MVGCTRQSLEKPLLPVCPLGFSPRASPRWFSFLWPDVPLGGGPATKLHCPRHHYDVEMIRANATDGFIAPRFLRFRPQGFPAHLMDRTQAQRKDLCLLAPRLFDRGAGVGCRRPTAPSSDSRFWFGAGSPAGPMAMSIWGCRLFCSTDRIPRLQPEHDATIGVRIGEASHPGPSGEHEVTVAVINPTAILNKHRELLELESNLILASETSATARTQQVVQSQLHRLGLTSRWGCPVAEQQETRAGVCVRGLSIGTAAFTSLPSRPSIEALPPAQHESCRISECFVRIAAIEIRVITIYGWPRCSPESSLRNNLLLGWAYSRATSNQVPTLIGGDFNQSVQSLPVWQAFQGMGWVEAHEFSDVAFQCKLPPTCKGATNFDSLLIPAFLQQFLVKCDVMADSHLFDSHSPFGAHFRFPRSNPPNLCWRLPLKLCPKDVATAYSAGRQAVEEIRTVSPAASFGSSLRVWAAVVEESVSDAVGRLRCREPDLNWPQSLPRAYRGRCLLRQRTTKEIPRLPRNARHGEPQPLAEATSVCSRQKLRQWRRLRVLQQGVSKFRSLPNSPTDYQVRCLRQQWCAILQAPGYRGSFSEWALGWPEVPFLSLDVPSEELLQLLGQLVKFDYEAFAKAEAKHRKQTFLYQVRFEGKARNMGPTFARMKPPPPETLRVIKQVISHQASEVRRHSWHRRDFQCAGAGEFLLHQEVEVAGVTAIVTGVDEDRMRLLFPVDDDIVVPATVTVQQCQTDCTPQGVGAALVRFWHPIWSRDTVTQAQDLQEWPVFQQIVASLPQQPPVPVDMLDMPAWYHAISKLPACKATGCCGFHNCDLKSLPRQAVTDLAHLFAAAEDSSFPPELQLARVAVLGKVPFPTDASQARPITILSNVYRLWARVFCQQIIKIWSMRFPAGILGCLKSRSAQDLAYLTQQLAETAQINGEACSGITLDLRKAFNFLPRAPLGELLRRLGVPEKLVKFWLTGLHCVQRLFQTGPHLGPPLPGTTGAPEGDPVSVLAMLSVCFMYHHVMEPVVRPASYMDNWSWTTDLREAHGPALQNLLELTDSLKMQVDWAKTYFWSTVAEDRTWWRSGAHLLLPANVVVPVLHHVRELGAHISFSKRHALGHMTQAFESATTKLHRLFHEPSPLLAKAQVVQQGVWSSAFYGALSVAPGRHRFQSLRCNAARAIVGRHHTMSSIAALYFLPHVEDPEPYLMILQARHLHRTMRLQPLVATEVLKVASMPGLPKTVHGPGTALRTMFLRLGWEIGADGLFTGPGNNWFCISSSSPLEIKNAILEAWALEVQAALLGRSGLRNLGVPSRKITQSVFSHLETWEQMILARHVTGAYMSKAEKSTWSRDTTEHCDLCGQLDTKWHRLFQCEATRHVRDAHKEIVQVVQSEFAHWAYLTVAEEPPDLDFLRVVTKHRSLPPVLEPPPWTASVFLFTDGSAHNSSCADARLTYWSVVWCRGIGCSSEILAWSHKSHCERAAAFQVLGQGCTPARQTVPRAEFSAIVWAARWAVQIPEVEIWIFSDCQFAIGHFEALQSGDLVPGHGVMPDLEVLLPISNRISLHKVKAHNSAAVEGSTDSFLQWSTLGNELADAAAKLARTNEIGLVRESADSVAEAVKYQSAHLLAFARFLIDINLEEISLKDALQEPVCPADGPEAIQAAVASIFEYWLAWDPPDTIIPSVPEDGEARIVGPVPLCEFRVCLLRWLEQLQWPALPLRPADVGEVSCAEIFLAFVGETNLLPPFSVGKGTAVTWLAARSDEAKQLPRGWLQTVQEFVEHVNFLERLIGRDLFLAPRLYGLTRLQHHGLAVQIPGVAFRPLLQGVTDWLPVLLLLSRGETSALFRYVGSRNAGMPFLT